MTWLDHPLFLCGHRKSGTTLLLSLFDRHPQRVAFPPDSGFFYGVYPHWCGPSHDHAARVQRVIDVLFANFRTDLDRLDGPPVIFPHDAMARRFRERMADLDATPATLLQQAIAAYAEASAIDADPLRGWVEKTTSTEIYAVTVAEWFPNARFIHIVRDPRDNFASLKSGWAKRYRAHNDSVERLLQSLLDRGGLGMRFAHANAVRLGSDRYRVIRYEDLVARPDATMTELAAFAGIDDVASLRQPTYHGRPWGGNNFEGRTFDRPSDENVGRWRERIDPHEAALIEFHLGPVMEQWGYERACTTEACMEAATRHYQWANFAQQWSVADGAATYGGRSTSLVEPRSAAGAASTVLDAPPVT